MWPDRASNPRPLTYESGALPTGLRGPTAMESKNLTLFEDRKHVLGTYANSADPV